MKENHHPNRRKPPVEGVPTPDQIKAARAAAGLTRAEAAALVHCSEIAWKHWEAGTLPMAWATWFAFTKLASASRAAPPSPLWREQGVTLAEVVAAKCPVCHMGIKDDYCVDSPAHPTTAGFHGERVSVAATFKAAREASRALK